MGMFDTVIPPLGLTCIQCDAKIDTTAQWQSKSGPCLMYILPWTEVDRFYTSCPQCNAWNEWRRKKPSRSFHDEFERHIPEIIE